MPNNKSFSIGLAIILAMIVLAGCGSQATPAPPQGSTVAGTLTSKGTPLPNTQVILYDLITGETVAETRSDAQGKYQLANVTPGSYGVRVDFLLDYDLLSEKNPSHDLSQNLEITGEGPGGTILAKPYPAGEVYIDGSTYGITADTLISMANPIRLTFLQPQKLGDLGFELHGLNPEIKASAIGLVGLVLDHEYKLGELGIDLNGLNPDLDVSGISLGEDGKISFTLSQPVPQLNQLGIAVPGKQENQRTGYLSLIPGKWLIYLIPSLTGTYDLIAHGLEQLQIKAGETSQVDLDFQYP